MVDWVSDGAHLIHHLTRIRGHAGHVIDQAARRLRDWLRAHFHAACLGLSTFIAVGEVGALAVGERWPDTALIAFCVVLEIIGILAICFVINDRSTDQERIPMAAHEGVVAGGIEALCEHAPAPAALMARGSRLSGAGVS